MPKKLPTKRKIRKAISVNKPQSFLALPDSVRYQIYLFKNAILKYKNDVIRDLQKKLAKLQNTYNKDYIYFQTFNVKEYLIDVKSDLSEKLTLALKIFKAKLKEWSTQFKNFILAENQKETTIFKNTKIPLTFKPFYLTQGALVFAALLVIAITATTIIFPHQKPSVANIINQKSITIKQTSAAVAGSSDNIKWTAIIKKSDITNNKYLLKLPKTATNIKVKTISKQEAIALSNDRVPTAILAMSDRKVLAYQTVPATIFSKISKLMNYILADLEQAVTDAVQTITEQPLPEQTPEATLVDLSAEVPVVVDAIALTTADEKKADAESQKQENKELKETEKEPASVENFGEAKEKQDEKQETKQENQEKQEEVSVSSEVALTSDVIPAQAGIQSGSSDINTNLDSPLQGNDNEIQGNDNEIQGNDNEIQGNDNEIQGNDNEDDYIAVEYETSSPIITEQDTATGKIVTVSDPNETTTQSDLGSNDMFQDSNDVIPADAGIQSEGLDSLLQGNDNTTSLTNVLAFTTIPEIYKVGQEKAIRIKWKNENGQNMPFTAYDLNNNGKLDYIEWIVPHLSDQIFEIILISRAYHLDSNQEILEDVYDQVKTKDNNFATIPADNYIRVTFEKVLDNTRDITVWAKNFQFSIFNFQSNSNDSISQIEVYPVYTDENGIQTQGPKLDLVNDGTNPDFSSIDAYAKYRILLTNLTQPTDMFDLKVINASIDFDNIFDPVTDRYWVGGTGSWSDDDNHWALTSGGAAGNGNIPVSGDNVIFDASSGTGTVTIDTASVSMLNVTESSANIIVATSTNGITVTGDLYVAGTISGATAVTVSGAGKTITMAASSTISAPLTLGADATVSVGTGNTGTISGIISGAYNLSKIGAGQLTLSGNNTFTGGLTIKAGTVALSTSANAAGTGTITIGDTSGSANATLTGGVATIANPISVVSGSSGTLKINHNYGGTVTFSGNIALSNNLNLSSVTTRALVMSGSITGTGNITVNNVAATTGTVTLSGTSIDNIGTITNNGTATGTTTISAVIGTNVTGVIQNSSTSQLTLSGNNTFTGGVTIKAGTVALTTNATAAGTGTITIGDTSGSADATLRHGTELLTFANPITVASGSSGNTLKIEAAAGTGTFSGAITQNNTSVPLTLYTYNASLVLSGSISGAGAIETKSAYVNRTITLSGASINNSNTITNSGSSTGTTTISGVIGSNVTGVIQNSATSQLTLSGNNADYAGGVTIKAGTVSLTTSNNAGGTGTITLGDSTADAVVLKGSVLTYANPIVLANIASHTGTITISTFSGDVSFSGAVSGTNNLILTNPGTADLTLSNAAINPTGTITHTGASIGTSIISGIIGANVTGVVQNSATSQLTLSGANVDYANGVTVKKGILSLTTNTTAAGTGTITLGDSTADAVVLKGSVLTYANPIVLANIASHTGTITISAFSGDTSFSGAISGTNNLILTNPGVADLTLSNAAINPTGTITHTGASTGTSIISGIIGTNVTGVIQNSATSQLTLSGANTYTGATTVSAGTLQAGVASVAGVSGAFGNNSDVTMADVASAVLNITGYNTQIGSITGGGSTGGNVTLGAATLTIGGTTSPAAYGGVISGTGSLTKSGAGTLILSTTNTYTGDTTINGGTVLVGANVPSATNSPLGNTSNAIIIGDTTGSTNAYLLTNGAFTIGRNITVRAGSSGVAYLGSNTTDISYFTGNIALSKDVTLSATTGSTATFQTGVISGGFGVTKTGSGIATLTGSNTYTGATTISQGTLSANKIVVASSNSSLGNAASAVILGGAATSGTLYSTQGSITYTRGFTVNAGGGEVDTSTGTLTVATGGITANGALTVGRTGTITISAIIADGATAGSLVMVGTGTFTLSGANTFTGGLTIKAGTVLGQTSNQAFGDVTGGGTNGTIILGDSSGTADATLKGSGTLNFANPITVASGSSGILSIFGSAVSATTTFSGAIALSNNLTITSYYTLIISGNITGTGNLITNVSASYPLTISSSSVNHTGTITNSGSGTPATTISAVIGTNVTGVIQNSATSQLTLSGANTFTSGLTIKAGTALGKTSTSALGGSGTGTVTLGDTGGSANATLAISAAFANPITVASGSSGTLSISHSSGGGNLSGAIALNNNVTLTNSSWVGSGGYSGGITGTGNIIISFLGTSTFLFSTASINNIGTITNSGSGTGTITISAVIGTNVTGVIQNSATSQLTLSGVNTFTSGLTIKAGTVQLQTSTSAGGGSGTGTITIGDTSGSTAATLQGTGLTFANPIVLATGTTGTLTIQPSATSAIFSGGVTGTNNLTLNGSSTFTLTLSTATVNNVGTITNVNAGTGIVTISSVIGTNVTGITQNSSTSQLTLSGNNSTVGDIDIQAGTLTLAADKNLNVSDDWSNTGTFTASSGSTVTFTAGNHTVTGANTFINWTWSANNTVTLPASTTQTISGAFSCAGTAGNLITLNSATSGTKATISDASGTNSCDYMSITDSSATGGATFNATNSTGSNYDGWLGLNVAPNAPTLVSPANASYTTDTTPTLSANYSDNDAGDTGTTNYRISSSSLADCTNNTNVIASGTSSATADNNEDTTWTNGSSIGSDATYYWCAQNNDGTDTSSWTQMGSFTLDIASPTTVIAAGRNGNNINTTLTCSDTSGSGCTYTYYCYDTTNTCAPTTVYTTIDTHPITQTTYIRYYSVDAMSNANSVASEQFDLVGGSASAIPATPATPAEQPPLPNIIEQIAQQIQNIANTLDSRLRGNDNETAIIYPPIEESVPQQAPTALQGWDIMTVKPIKELGLNPIGSDIGFFAKKLPKLNETLKGLAINVDKASDVLKLNGVELFMPGLTQTVLTKSEILKINGVAKAGQIAKPEITPEGEQKIVSPGALTTNPFASVQGVPLAQLSPEALAKMPTGVIFARAAGGLIDFNISLAVAKEGNVTQKLSLISGKPFELVIKPDMPAEKVTGYITLLKPSAALKQENKPLSFINKILSAALLSSLDSRFPPRLGEAGRGNDNTNNATALLLQKFEYKETMPGVFSASLTTPIDEGEYQILTVIDYKDKTLTSKESDISATVDPEGYVFRQMPDGRLRIKDVKVSVYWFNSNSGKFDLWPAEKFLQKNPLATDETGKYSFLLPQGIYYLQAEAFGYSTYKGDSFEVKENIGVRQDIELKKNTWLPEWLNWQILTVVLLFVVVAMLFIIIYFFIKGRNIANIK